MVTIPKAAAARIPGDAGDPLGTRISEKRRQLDDYLVRAEPRRKKLINTTLIGGTLSAMLTAAPAIGGPDLSRSLSGGLGASSPAWRILCAGASVCSIVATLATQMLRSNQIEDHVVKALGARAKLEALDAAVAFGHVDPERAFATYLETIEDTPFLT